MKLIPILLRFSLVGILSLNLASCSPVLGDRIDPGYVALLVDNYGSEKGIQNAEIFTGGRVRYNSLSQELFEFPVFYRTYSFNRQEDKDESVNFSMGGSPVSMDLGVTYKFRYEPISQQNPRFTWLHQFFRNYRVSPDAFNGGALRNALRDCANESASGLNPVRMATNAATFVFPVKNCLTEKFPELDIKEISLLNPPRLPPNIQESINRAFQAQQDAQSAKATAEKAKAEAEANAAKADGEARVKLIEAGADAKANELRSTSINENLIQWEKLQVEKARVQRWNGQYSPTVQTQNVQLGQPTSD